MHAANARVRSVSLLLAASLLAGWMMAFLLPCPPARAADPSTLHEAAMQVIVNASAGGPTLIVLRDDAGALWLEQEDLDQLHLLTPSVAPQVFETHRYYPISAIPGASVQFDEPGGRALLHVPAEAFAHNRVSAPTHAGPPITPAALGSFLNYSLSAQRFADQRLVGGTAELGIFNSAGVLTNTALERSIDGQSDFVRLDTTFTKDFPARLETLAVGDTTTLAGNWGSTVRFGGVRWGTNFGLRPDMLTTPLLSAGGTAVVPSTVDVFVNNQKVATQNVPPGPFTIDQLPSVTGTGDVTLVVRNALGQQQVVTQPFYSSATLLAPGLSLYDVDLGVARNDYALASDRYAGLTGAATYQRGLNASFTLEAHGEFLGSQVYAAGADLAAALSRYGILSATAADGGGEGHNGLLGGLGYSWQARWFNIALNSSIAGSGYRQVNDAASISGQFKSRNLAQFGVNLRHGSSLQVAYVTESFDAAPGLRTLSLAYSQQLPDNVTLTLTATRTMTTQNASSLFLLFTVPLSGRRSVTAGATLGQGPGAPPNEASAMLVQTPPLGPGFGYRLGESSANNYTADGRWQTGAGDLEGMAVRNIGVSGQSLQWTGAATLIDGELRAARRVNESFAVVDVGGLPDVPVFLENQLITHTDANGQALLHDLRPYEVNRISVDPTDLPLDTELDARSIEVAPAFRSGVIVRFPVERIRAGIFRLLLSDGSSVPVGAQVHFNGGEFAVALGGRVYITGYDHGTTGEASWKEQSCTFRLPPPPAHDPQPDLGDITCFEQRPATGSGR